MKPWVELSANEWRRTVDGVKVLREGSGWKVRSASGTDAVGLGGQLRTWADAETARRQCDCGALEPAVLALYEVSDQAGMRALVEAIGLDCSWRCGNLVGIRRNT